MKKKKKSMFSNKFSSYEAYSVVVRQGHEAWGCRGTESLQETMASAHHDFSV